MAKVYQLKNLKDGDLAVGPIIWAKGETKSIRYVNQAMIDAVAAGSMSSDIDITPIDALADIVSAMNTITDSSTGTAATPAGGAVTIAAVSSTGAAANAVATIAVELTAAKAVIAALVTRVELLENHILEMEADRLRSIKVA